MITRIKDKDGDMNFTITPKFQIGDVVCYKKGSFELYSKIEGINAWIIKLNQGASYEMENGDEVSEKNVWHKMLPEGEVNADQQQQRFV